MGEERSTKDLFSNYQTTRCHSPEDCNTQ